MCTVSMIGDHFADKWRRPQPGYAPLIHPTLSGAQIVTPIGRHEFDALKRDVEEMKALLKRAKLYDEQNNEPDCEVEEKMDLLRKVAKLVGINLDDVIGKGSTA